jgi:hypothetical protein
MMPHRGCDLSNPWLLNLLVEDEADEEGRGAFGEEGVGLRVA